MNFQPFAAICLASAQLAILSCRNASRERSITLTPQVVNIERCERSVFRTFARTIDAMIEVCSGLTLESPTRAGRTVQAKM